MKGKSLLDEADSIMPFGCWLALLIVLIGFLFYGVAPWLLRMTAGG